MMCIEIIIMHAHGDICKQNCSKKALNNISTCSHAIAISSFIFIFNSAFVYRSVYLVVIKTIIQMCVYVIMYVTFINSTEYAEYIN